MMCPECGELTEVFHTLYGWMCARCESLAVYWESVDRKIEEELERRSYEGSRFISR